MIGYEKLFRYDDWANREALGSLPRGGVDSPLARSRMAHIIAAERLWHARLTRDPARVVVWPDLTLAQCETALDELRRDWTEYLPRLTAAALEESVSYVNSKGEPWTSKVDDVLTHVILHSSYHRGQIAADVRAAGGEPAYSDYIHAVRQGRLAAES